MFDERKAYMKSKESWDKFYKEKCSPDSVHYFFTKMTQEEFNDRIKKTNSNEIEKKKFEFNKIRKS
jgi:hypothetical protein